ncbi:unnamed protein product, partial [Didymodactylos carnosus]
MKRTFSNDEFDKNGDSLSGTQVNDISKKSRSEPVLPSRVVHLRNIEASEIEVVQLGLPFGRVTNFLNLRKKSQAFLEFDSCEHAKTMVDYFNSGPAMLNGRQVFAQFSNHGELRTDPTNRSNQQAHIALTQATELYETAQKGGPNCVLRISIINMLFPVSIDVLHQIFTKFGAVLKIITFTKNDKFQALIQMKDHSGAQQAKLQLHGQNIYNGCCTLQIEYSKLYSLTVKYNNDKSRDYTNPTLPSGDSQQTQLQSNTDQMTNMLDSRGLHSNNSLLSLNRSNSNDDYRYSIFDHRQNCANPLINAPPSFNPMQSQYGLGAAQMVSHLQQQQQQLPSQQAVQNGPVILVSNLNEDMITPEALFTLFGVYGDVHRVKILFNKKDSALIQFATPQQAAVAHQHLDHITMFGKQIKVSFSKHQFVQMPKEGGSDMGLTKDFTNSPLHRFKKPGSKNYNNIYPPGPVLHLSNIPTETSEEEIRRIFSQYGTIKRFKFFEKDRKMALIEMDSIEEAIAALINTHNYRLADSMHLRVSFSKTK